MDLHTHTHHSFDGENETVAERILCAGKLGLRYMAITDHVEINRWFPAKYYGAKPPETPEEAEMFPFDGMSAFLGSLAETHAEKQNCTAGSFADAQTRAFLIQKSGVSTAEDRRTAAREPAAGQNSRKAGQKHTKQARKAAPEHLPATARGKVCTNRRKKLQRESAP
jgi:hypothetical protein